jgi:hypothetical protein
MNEFAYEVAIANSPLRLMAYANESLLFGNPIHSDGAVLLFYVRDMRKAIRIGEEIAKAEGLRPEAVVLYSIKLPA